MRADGSSPRATSRPATSGPCRTWWGHVLDHFAPADFEPGGLRAPQRLLHGLGALPGLLHDVAPLRGRTARRFRAVNIAHHVDMGGRRSRVPRSWTCARAFQEGLRILPVRVARRGELREDVLRLILGNVRLPEIVRGDLLAQRNANAGRGGAVRGARRQARSRSGRDRHRRDPGPLRGAECASSSKPFPTERGATRTSWTTTPGPASPFASTSRSPWTETRSSSTGRAAAIRWKPGINSYINYTRAYSGFAIKVFTDPHLPQNEGVNRPVEIRARSGIVLQPRVPGPEQRARHQPDPDVRGGVRGVREDAPGAREWRASRTGATR